MFVRAAKAECAAPNHHATQVTTRAAASYDAQSLPCVHACRYIRVSKAVRRAERAANPVDAQRIKESDARRKRVRRVDDGKEDRDALRTLANSCNDGTMLEPLDATPAGLRETAMDGTPRSAKAAGARLRALTQTFYERMQTSYGVTYEELLAVRVETELWDTSVPHRQGWEKGTRPLKRFGGKLHVLSRETQAGGAPVRRLSWEHVTPHTPTLPVSLPIGEA